MVGHHGPAPLNSRLTLLRRAEAEATLVGRVIIVRQRAVYDEQALEVGPLLVNKQVVAVEDATVRPPPFRAFRDRSVEREKTRAETSPDLAPARVPGPANDPDLPPFPSPSSRKNR